MKTNKANEVMVGNLSATSGAICTLPRSMRVYCLPTYDWWDALGLIARIAAAWLIALYFPVPFVPTR